MVAIVPKGKGKPGRRPKPKALDGEKLRALRLSKGWSQPQFAELVGVHEVDISRYERGEFDPSLYTVVTIARILGVDVSDLLKNK